MTNIKSEAGGGSRRLPSRLLFWFDKNLESSWNKRTAVSECL